MKGSRPPVLITGATGLIGAALARRLVEQYPVIACDRARDVELPGEVDFVLMDLSSDESVKAGFEQVKRQNGTHLASVIHLAAYYDFSGEPSPLYEEVTVQGTRRVLEALQGFTVEQFAFSSTMLVHAPCEPGQRITEDWPLRPAWDYPESKVRTEQLLRANRGKIPVVLLRIAGVYDDLCHSIPIAHQIQRIYERRMTSRVYPGELNRGQAFVHIDDLVDAIVRGIELRSELDPELPVLIGEPETLGYGELQQLLGQLIHGEEWETTVVPKSLAKAGAWVQDNLPLMEDPFIKPWMIDMADDHYALDITRARTLLGWQPRHSLRESLPRMVEALKADPEVWCGENKLGSPPKSAPQEETPLTQK